MTLSQLRTVYFETYVIISSAPRNAVVLSSSLQHRAELGAEGPYKQLKVMARLLSKIHMCTYYYKYFSYCFNGFLASRNPRLRTSNLKSTLKKNNNKKKNKVHSCYHTSESIQISFRIF